MAHPPVTNFQFPVIHFKALLAKKNSGFPPELVKYLKKSAKSTKSWLKLGGYPNTYPISNFREDFVDFADFFKYLTNSGGKPKKNFFARSA